jgi:hypothetical protein
MMVFLTITGTSQEKKIGFFGYSGGMMLHTGFVSGKPMSFAYPDGASYQNLKIEGLPFGIGGAIKINFSEHFRIGAEGYISTLTYGEYGSYSKCGWGGILFDYALQKARWSFFAGATIGSGSVNNLTLFDDMPLDNVIENHSVSYRNYKFMALTPFAGVEYALSDKMHAIFKMDSLFNINHPQADFVTGPRFYFGIMFTHENKN